MKSLIPALFLALLGTLSPSPAAAEVRFALTLQTADEALQSFRYEPALLPDPFEPYSVEEEPTQKLTPLQKVDLEEIEILGIATGTREPAARVKVQGEYFTIKKGDAVGKNHGRVAAIREGEIVVRERYRDDANVTRSRDVALKLSR